MNNVTDSRPAVVWSDHAARAINVFEGDCACPLPKPPAESGTWWPGVAGDTWWTPPVVEVPLDEAHIILVIVTPRGGIAVLNRSAYGIWDQLRRCHRVAPDDPVCKRLDVPVVLRQLWQAGLILPAPYTPPPTASSDTLQVWLHLTQNCNLACSYCYLTARPEAMPEDLGRRAVKTVFRTARQHHYQAVHLKYAGGEPLLMLPRLLAIHDEARALAAHHHIRLHGAVLTNGVLLDDAILAALSERDLALVVSLDGIGEVHDRSRPVADGHGSFAAVERGLMLAQARGLAPRISITVTSATAPALADTVTWLLDRKLPFSFNFYRALTRVQFSTIGPPSSRQVIEGLQAALDVLEQRLPPYSVLAGLLDRVNLSFPHPHACSAGQDYLVIGPDGAIAPCQMQIDRPTTGIAADDPLTALRHEWARTSRAAGAGSPAGACSTCRWAQWCAGGCPLPSAHDQSMMRSSYCDVYRTMIPAVLRLEAKRLLAGAVERM